MMTVGNVDTEQVLVLTAVEFRWIRQEVDRQIQSLDILLGGISDEERRTASRKIVDGCMEKLRKGRAVC